MSTFVLVHGAGDAGWYWHLTEAELRARGHHTVAPDLSCDNDTASLDDYARAVAEAAAGQPDLVIVGQSYGAFTATLAASQLPARLFVLLAGMIPAPGESPGQWWTNTGYRRAAPVRNSPPPTAAPPWSWMAFSPAAASPDRGRVTNSGGPGRGRDGHGQFRCDRRAQVSGLPAGP
ncbi:MAG TPA: alpha/beta fold hydrolase [Mycobacteriales bacterium]|nr:alpha/beta fold hydrolase [Mycobacteriales bacterium]